MTEISKERIERAHGLASSLGRYRIVCRKGVDGCESAAFESCECPREYDAQSIKTIESTLAAAELRGKIAGLVEAGRLISGYRETTPGRKPSPLDSIDDRITALRAELEKMG